MLAVVNTVGLAREDQNCSIAVSINYLNFIKNDNNNKKSNKMYTKKDCDTDGICSAGIRILAELSLSQHLTPLPGLSLRSLGWSSKKQ